MILLRALGNAEIDTGVATLTPSQEIVFAAALYLILERGKRVSRAQLASLLWPRVPEKARGHRLRQTILRLKKLGIMVSVDRNNLQLSRHEVKSDLDELLAGDSGTAGGSDGKEFLPGYNPYFSVTFRDWVDTAREQAHTALTRNFLLALETARERANWPMVESISAQCLLLDPYNESAVLARAEACAMRGQKVSAVSMLDRYIEEVGPRESRLALPAAVLRKRIVHRATDDLPQLFAATEPSFVGRECEMATLRRFLDGARAGAGRACLIEGEPGIGKTRLFSELAKFAELQGIGVERVTCKRADVDQPLSAFVNLVPALREMPGALGCSQDNLAWLKRLTEFDTSSPEQLIPREEFGTLYTRLRAAILDLLDAVSEERCLIIIVEDIQWLDAASAKLFAALIESVSGKKLFLLFNSRQANNILLESLPPHKIATMHLSPLESSDASGLIRTISTRRTSQDETIDFDWIVAAGDGNPFFLQELAKQRIETGRKHDVPPSVMTVLDERISRLTSVARQLLQACAILGENSTLERVERVLEYAPHQLLTGVQELSIAGMLRSSCGIEGGGPSLLIRHDLVSIAVLNPLAAPALAFLHRRCGVVLEGELHGSSISTALLRACAFHWHHSGDSARAYSAALKCANHLLEIGLGSDAATAFEAALAYCSTIENRIDVLGRMVQAFRMARTWPPLLATIARIRDLRDSGGSAPYHHDDLEIVEFEALRRSANDIAPLFSRTLKCAYDSSLPPIHRVAVASVALKLATGLPDLPELKKIYFSVKPLLGESTVDDRARLQVEVVYNTMCGDLKHAVSLAKQRVTLERTQGTPYLLTTALTDLAFVLHRAGPTEEMVATLEEAYDIAIQHNLTAIARDPASRMVSFLIETDRPGLDVWRQRSLACYGDATEAHLAFSLNADSVRIALRENRINDAKTILVREFDRNWLRYRRGWLAGIIGLWIRTRIAESAAIEEIRPDVEELRALYDHTSTLGAQDDEVVALYRGLTYINASETAQQYLRDYLSGKRRDLTAYSRDLAEIAQSLPAGAAYGSACSDNRAICGSVLQLIH